MAETRRRIVEAAAELFSRRGYSATTTRAIAEAAQVNEVTLFRRFGSKSGVLEAIGEAIAASPRPEDIPVDVEDIRLALTESARQSVAGIAEFGACALRLTLDAAEQPEVAAAMSGEVGPAANMARLSGLFHEWQREGRMRADVPAAVLAEGYVGLTSNLLMAQLALAPATFDIGEAEQRLAALVDVFCDGCLTGGQR